MLFKISFIGCSDSCSGDEWNIHGALGGGMTWKEVTRRFAAGGGGSRGFIALCLLLFAISDPGRTTFHPDRCNASGILTAGYGLF